MYIVIYLNNKGGIIMTEKGKQYKATKPGLILTVQHNDTKILYKDSKKVTICTILFQKLLNT